MKIKCENGKYSIDPELNHRYIEDFLPLEFATFKADVCSKHPDSTVEEFKFYIVKEELWCSISNSAAKGIKRAWDMPQSENIWYQYEPTLRMWQSYPAPELS